MCAHSMDIPGDEEPNYGGPVSLVMRGWRANCMLLIQKTSVREERRVNHCGQDQ